MTMKRRKSDVRQRQAQIAVRLLPHEDAHVRDLARAEGTSAAEVLRRALQHYLAATMETAESV